jgi:hypothetical protein
MDFFDTVFGWVSDTASEAVDWLFGTDSGMGEDYGTPGVLSNLYGYGESFLGSGNILETGARLAGAYLSGTGDQQKSRDPKDYLLNIGQEGPRTKGVSSGRVSTVGANNPQIQNAIRQLANRTNVNSQTADISRVFLTARQGQRTLGVGSPTVSRVAPIGPAAVRTDSKEVDLA